MEHDIISRAYVVFGQSVIDYIQQHKEIRAEDDKTSMAPTLAEYLSVMLANLEGGQSVNDILRNNQIPIITEEDNTGTLARGRYTYDGLREYIHTFSVADIIDNLQYIFSDNYSTIDRAKAMALIQSRAAELKQATTINKALKAYEKEYISKHPEEAAFPISAECLKLDKDGNPKNTIYNYAAIMENDPFYNGGAPLYQRILFNVVSNRAEVHTLDAKGNLTGVRNWEEADDAESNAYIQEKYGIYDPRQHNSALLTFWRGRSYNPITIHLDELRPAWDGEERCENFLTEWAKADDSAYTKAVSRMIFDAAVARAYDTGDVKIDTVPVLIGKQGQGKSRICEYLSFNQNYFLKMPTFSSNDKENSEKLEGKWIVELEEIVVKQSVDFQNALKSFITRQKDSYRKPWGRGVGDYPRRCIFIGTTNILEFLSDRTGNRRYLPIKCNCDGKTIFTKEKEIRAYIEQCYAEAVQHYDNADLLLTIPEHLQAEAEARQADSMQSSVMYDAIMDFIADKLPVGATTTIREICVSALHLDEKDLVGNKPFEQTISIIINNCPYLAREKRERINGSRQTIYRRTNYQPEA